MTEKLYYYLALLSEPFVPYSGGAGRAAIAASAAASASAAAAAASAAATAASSASSHAASSGKPSTQNPGGVSGGGKAARCLELSWIKPWRKWASASVPASVHILGARVQGSADLCLVLISGQLQQKHYTYISAAYATIPAFGQRSLVCLLITSFIYET